MARGPGAAEGGDTEPDRHIFLRGAGSRRLRLPNYYGQHSMLQQDIAGKGTLKIVAA